ncbi:MAG TPA: hypothetical protein VGR02_03155 [Thermoanaerobaculia bacterium]|jgi:hypothetical protein|nr:hypothetical protein [Thermoanaerobaculia bacterium]
MRRNLLRLGRALAFVVLVSGIAIALQLVWPAAHAAPVYLAAVAFAAIVVAPLVYWLRPPDTALLRARITELESELEEREQQWNAKLNQIVEHLASDHESDLGDAMLEKEGARAEVRQLKVTVTELLRQLSQLHASPVSSSSGSEPSPDSPPSRR